ncbi:hypothetical protein ETAA8_65860 [Anatilimnocola aggregata]|uniref:Uncharacterized protein n=1 Tax=Anatilimnocola aggregata TaxID=2528021 RepID=A0A517YMH9_9BACT|nr:hypothetical protein ETAA8_65860 [Anatilimnocola aggregata]
MDVNPYESPSTENPTPTPKTRKRYFAIYVLFAILGFCAAFVLTAPMGAIDGGTEPYWFGGAAVAAFAYRIMWS